MKTKIFFALILALTSLHLFAFLLPSNETQKKIFKSVRDEMIRLDGEGLIARKGRPENFQATTDKLITDIDNNKTIYDFYSSFKKLDATYTNLHSKVTFPNEVYDQVQIPWYKNQSVWLFTEVDKTSFQLRVEHFDDPELEKQISSGDEVVAINGRSIKDWLAENLLFCKYPMSIQCHRAFEMNLMELNLSWKGNTPLVYSIKHDGKIVNINISFSEMRSSDPLRKRCDYKSDKRYPGFKLVHLGFYACLYEKITDPSIALLRIVSFQYNRNNTINPYKSVGEEVLALEKEWLPRSQQYKNLIVDVLNNGGGNLPVAYYQILFKGSFQEQYYQTKKIPEFEDARIRAGMIWEEPGHELQYQEHLKSGLWEALKYGEFTPPEPMFCASEDKPCIGPMFEAKKHNFNGRVHIMLNEGCVSSCDGFVFALKESLNADLYGFYQAADSTYSRLRINVIRDDSNADGFKIEVAPQYDPLPKDLIVSQVVATSRSTDKNGVVFSGNPIELKVFVPYKLEEFYPATVLNKILENIK